MKKEWLTVAQLNAQKNTLVAHLGIEFLLVTAEKLVARMPVDTRTVQPMGILHGGASVVLAETLGSVGASLHAAEGFHCVGLEINANHLRSVREGYVVGTAKPLHLGRTTQVWDIRIEEEATQKAVCVSRLTLAVIPAKD